MFRVQSYRARKEATLWQRNHWNDVEMHSPDWSFDSRWNSSLSLLHWIDNSTQNVCVCSQSHPSHTPIHNTMYVNFTISHNSVRGFPTICGHFWKVQIISTFFVLRVHMIFTVPYIINCDTSYFHYFHNGAAVLDNYLAWIKIDLQWSCK